jgi:hypothetical protein
MTTQAKQIEMFKAKARAGLMLAEAVEAMLDLMPDCDAKNQITKEIAAHRQAVDDANHVYNTAIQRFNR